MKMRDIIKRKGAVIGSSVIVVLFVVLAAYRGCVATHMAGAASFFTGLEEEGLLAPAVAGLVGFVSCLTTALISIFNNSATARREREKEARESLLLFYEPLLVIARSLAGYLEEDDRASVDLQEYDPDKAAYRRKLSEVSVYVKELRPIFSSYRIALTEEGRNVSPDLSKLRLWIVGVDFINRNGYPLSGDTPSDREIVDAVRHLETEVDGLRKRLSGRGWRPAAWKGA